MGGELVRKEEGTEGGDEERSAGGGTSVGEGSQRWERLVRVPNNNHRACIHECTHTSGQRRVRVCESVTATHTVCRQAISNPCQLSASCGVGVLTQAHTTTRVAKTHTISRGETGLSKEPVPLCSWM